LLAAADEYNPIQSVEVGEAMLLHEAVTLPPAAMLVGVTVRVWAWVSATPGIEAITAKEQRTAARRNDKVSMRHVQNSWSSDDVSSPLKS
jgi:hypothetical protein